MLPWIFCKSLFERMKGGPRAGFFKRVVLGWNQNHNGHAGIKEGEAKEYFL